nr:uncharacterized protein LOC107276829 [Oryza sativa Japonica Group]
MEMHECCYYGGSIGGDWLNPLAAIPPPCSSSSSSWSSQLLLLSDHDDVLLHSAGDHGGAVAGIGGACMTADLVVRDEEMEMAAGYLPVAASAAAAADVDHYMYQQFQLEPDQFVSTLPAVAVAVAATAGGGSHDDELLRMPFTDIDLDAFADARDVVVGVGEPKPSPQHTLDAAIALPAVGGGGAHHFGTQDDDVKFDVTKQRNDAALAGDDSLSMVIVESYEMGMRRHAAEQEQEQKPKIITSAATTLTPLPLPPPPPPPPRVTRSRRDGSSAATAGGKTRLDHIGFEDLRRYFYMPITKAAREMNVGLTVLKKRCRELGVARWPHRKMKSLKSLILNVQEMGSKGMSAAAMRRELEALENCCALMERNPAVELTERTKKLRQACFKENYKRRRAAAVDVLDLDHCFSFAAA